MSVRRKPHIVQEDVTTARKSTNIKVMVALYVTV